MRAAFITSSALPDLAVDDRLTLEPLRALGIEVAPVIWDQNPSLEGFGALVFRSCWDYHTQHPKFIRWLESLRRLSLPVFNPVSTLIWYSDKSYLIELEAQGIPLPKSVLIPTGTRANLKECLSRAGLDQAVVKPTISATGYDTWRTSLNDAPSHQNAFERLLQRKSVLLQEFMPEILSEGELSFVFFNGAFSHCVRKNVRSGEFRIQEEHGGTQAAFDPDPALVTQARNVLSHLNEPPLYARVDGIRRDERLILMELELIEPSLYFACDPASPARFASALAARLS